MVRFCRSTSSQRTTFRYVSIPPWFDFARTWCATVTATTQSFNPTLVRFCRRPIRKLRHALQEFQSHLGSILPPPSSLTTTRASGVSIPPWFDFAPLPTGSFVGSERGFNPTLVRFCPKLVFSAQISECVFQSHLGSILPELVEEYERIASRFNPTLVRFCRWCAANGWGGDRCFNPTLVRFCPGALRAVP